ncbi:tyrosine phosphatase family protein [Mesorhizobium sp. BAC0120]|uniref:tyrosine phosphatase family protein n=1 Tax=Mesorhizobium sp. BAC0120 TaxID=3090670 RepID=UPI00298CB5E8|nr:tyrosine phosphatase family protein [Mesorhizobium sp. BAC0120]MDW6020536.1 tyrosine phosphatase family protein [Mesorhizobium sp. BAC0120]
MIYVCPLSKIEETAARTGANRMVTLITAGTQVLRPTGLAEADHLFLAMHDIIEELPDMTPPGDAHVEALLDFAHNWNRRAPLLIHCFAGISRSTAAAYTVAAALAPQRDEAELAATLRRVSPSATPNIRLVSIADRLLGRQGRMIAAIESIGRGVEAAEGVPFALQIDG